jgi:hypothetical protein
VNVDDLDPFGTLCEVPDGVVVREITPRLWDGRDRPDEWLPWVHSLVQATGLAPWWEKKIAAAKEKPGRPNGVSVEAALTGLFGTASINRGFAHTEVARLLHTTASDALQDVLGIRPLLHGTARLTGDLATSKHLKRDWAIERRVGRRMDSMIDVINPSPWKQPQRLVTEEEAALMLREKTPEQLAQAQADLDKVVQDILAAPYKVMNRDLRRQWNGAKSVDGTGMPLAARKRGEWSKHVSWDRDGGWFSHADKPTGDRHAHRKTKATSKVKKGKSKGAKVSRTPADGYFGMEAHLIIAADDTVGDRSYFPALPLALALDAPAFRPGVNATGLLRELNDRKVKKGILSGDRLYIGQNPERFHALVEEYGGAMLTDFRIDMLGRQGNHQGADQIEGNEFCPMMPDVLANATIYYRDKTHADYKNLPLWQARMKARTVWMMRNKSAPKEDGRRQLQCPSAGSSPVMKCSLKPQSVDLVLLTKQPDGTVADSRPEVIIHEDKIKNGEVPTCCSQPTFTLQKADGLKHRQAEQYGLPKHAAKHQAMRNSQEGIHNFAKDDQHEALASPGKRRKRGVAAQRLYQAIGWAVAALRKIVFFIKHARTDSTGRLWVPRDLNNPSGGTALGAVGYRDELDRFDEDDPPETT